MLDQTGDWDQVKNWVRHATASRILGEVLSALGVAGIQAMPVKGILTAHLLYGDVAERPIRDVDLRVGRQDFGRVLDVARRHRWQHKTDSPHLWEVVMSHPDWPLAVDVECTVSDPGLCALSIAEMIRRATPSTLPLGFDHLQPEIHDHSLLLALNSFKDGLRPVPWALEDLRRIVSLPEFTAEVLVARAAKGRVLTALWIVADWMAREHGVGEWSDVRSLIGKEALSGRVLETYAFALRRGWPPRASFLLTASASDSALRASWGLGLAAAGVIRGRLNGRYTAVQDQR